MKKKIDLDIIEPKLFEDTQMYWQNSVYINLQYGTVSGIILQHHWAAFQDILKANNVKIKLTEWICDIDKEQERIDKAREKMRAKLGLKQ